MTELSFISFKSHDSLPTPIDIFFYKENLAGENNELDYEFEENDSHITDLVKDYCDSEDYFSEDESVSSSKPLRNTKSKESFNSLASFETNDSTNLFKISQVFSDENVKKSITDYKMNLFNKFCNTIVENEINYNNYNKFNDNINRSTNNFFNNNNRNCSVNKITDAKEFVKKTSKVQLNNKSKSLSANKSNVLFNIEPLKVTSSFKPKSKFYEEY